MTAADAVATTAAATLAIATTTIDDREGSPAGRLRWACSRPAVWLTAPLLALSLLLLLLLPAGGLVYHIDFDRRGLPDLEPFVRFELSTIGQVYDARGAVLVELAREYRRVVSYDEVPAVLRHAILAAEDKIFFSLVGGRAPRAAERTHEVAVWRNRAGPFSPLERSRRKYPRTSCCVRVEPP
jgi:hypothetical protein